MDKNPVTTLPYIEPKIELISTVQVSIERYDELVKKEARLELLENALRKTSFISDIKELFSLEGAAN